MAGSPPTPDDWTEAWSRHYRVAPATRTRTAIAPRMKGAVLAACVLLLAATTVAAAQGGDGPASDVVGARGEGEAVALGDRNPSSGGSTRETAIVADVANGGLVMRPSNTAKGGRAISATCDNDGLAAEDGCAVYVNKGQGAAASFRTQGAVPFALRETNTGKVDYLNADMVDGKHASELQGATGPQGPQGPPGADGAPGTPGTPGAPATRLWGTVDDDGVARTGSGMTGASRVASGTYNVTFDRDVSSCGRMATLGLPVPVGSAGVYVNATIFTVDGPNVGAGADTVRVRVWDAQTDAAVNSSFHVAVFC